MIQKELTSKNLMIGDWVMYNPYVEDLPSFRIKNGEDIDSAADGWFCPISLSPETLIKNGWEKCNIDIDKDDVQYGVSFEKLNFTWWRDAKVLGCNDRDTHFEIITELPIKYVHELQHVLRICQIDKEIIL